jgi:hypothetical protein
MSTPQRRRTPLPPAFWAAAGVAVAVSWTHAFIPALRTEPWEWVRWVLLAIQAIVLVIAIVYFVGYLREQRDDYWREQGKDPRRPEA